MLLCGGLGSSAVGLDRRAQHCLVRLVREHVDLVRGPGDNRSLPDALCLDECLSPVLERRLMLPLSPSEALGQFHNADHEQPSDADDLDDADQSGYHCMIFFMAPMA